MLVTLFVDASFFHATKSGAWALYAISEKDRLTYAGRFRQPIKDSSHAELAAIANALHTILPHPLSAGATRILIQTDCKGAIEWIANGSCKHHPEVLQHILDTLDKYGVAHELRHIKAHVGTAEPRTYCHDWCDREARRIARTMHRERGGNRRNKDGGKGHKHPNYRKKAKKKNRLMDGDRVVGTYTPMP